MKTFQIQELIDRIENNYDPEEIELIIDKGDFDLNKPSISMTIVFEEELIEKWQILIEGYLNSRIVFKTPVYNISLEVSHPLLWEYNDVHASLYFNGDTDRHYELVWDLIKINRSLYGPYVPLFKYFNEEKELEKLITAKTGLLAKGPKKLLLEYGACLNKYGFNYSITNERRPTILNEEKKTIVENKAQVLFIGQSYIIANDFHVLGQEA